MTPAETAHTAPSHTAHTDPFHTAPSIRKRHTVIAAAITATLAIIAASCGGSDDSTTQDSADSGVVSGAESSAEPDVGATLYQSNCSSCHGADLGGTDTGPSHLSIVYEPNHHGDDAFRSAILNGAQQHHWDFGDMEPITGLDDNQIDAIIAYVRSEQVRQGFQQ